MKITRVIALSIMTCAMGVPAVQAQSLENAGPPAEFPPASYKGKQYVDSKGCVFIRAGIDGNVSWVPRVSRSRKQLCGYQPTAVAGTTRAPTQSAAPQLITVPTAQQPTKTTPAKPATSVASTTAPATAVPTKPQRPTTTATSASSSATVAAPVTTTTPPKPAQQPVAAAPVASTTVPTTQAPSGCANASALSQQYSNDGARCGPQAASPVTYGNGSAIGPQSSLRLTPNTRVVQTHVYQARRHSQDLDAPAGFRSVWDDDRLNLHRAERGLKPAVIGSVVEVPRGYVLVSRDDDRLNKQRAMRTEDGDAQSDLIWTRTVPRKLVDLPLDRPVVNLSANAALSPVEDQGDLVMRLSTRSAPDATTILAAPVPNRYVRAATYADPATARQAARALAASGLPVRLGNVTRKGQVFRVVLAGPFRIDATAQAALKQVRAAGYSGARLSK